MIETTFSLNDEDFSVALDDVRRKRPTSGGRELGRWLVENKDTVSIDSLAAAIGVTPQAISNWIFGWCRPRKNSRKKLHALTGISPKAFDVFLDNPEKVSVRAKKLPRKPKKKLRGREKVIVTAPQDAPLPRQPSRFSYESVFANDDGVGPARERTTWDRAEVARQAEAARQAWRAKDAPEAGLLVAKAALCLLVARSLLSPNTSEDHVEETASAFMHLPHAELLSMRSRVAS